MIPPHPPTLVRSRRRPALLAVLCLCLLAPAWAQGDRAPANGEPSQAQIESEIANLEQAGTDDPEAGPLLGSYREALHQLQTAAETRARAEEHKQLIDQGAEELTRRQTALEEARAAFRQVGGPTGASVSWRRSWRWRCWPSR